MVFAEGRAHCWLASRRSAAAFRLRIRSVAGTGMHTFQLPVSSLILLERRVASVARPLRHWSEPRKLSEVIAFLELRRVWSRPFHFRDSSNRSSSSSSATRIGMASSVAHRMNRDGRSFRHHGRSCAKPGLYFRRVWRSMDTMNLSTTTNTRPKARSGLSVSSHNEAPNPAMEPTAHTCRWRAGYQTLNSSRSCYLLKCRQLTTGIVECLLSFVASSQK